MGTASANVRAIIAVAGTSERQRRGQGNLVVMTEV